MPDVRMCLHSIASTPTGKCGRYHTPNAIASHVMLCHFQQTCFHPDSFFSKLKPRFVWMASSMPDDHICKMFWRWQRGCGCPLLFMIVSAWLMPGTIQSVDINCSSFICHDSPTCLLVIHACCMLGQLLGGMTPGDVSSVGSPTRYHARGFPHGLQTGEKDHV